MINAINWFEIPTNDLERASKFYEAALATKLKRETFMGTPNAMFPFEPKVGAGGALVQSAHHKPAATGTIVYLHAPDLDGILSRVAAAGGKVVLPKTHIGDPGHIAVIEDTEGNHVGLHAPPVRPSA